MPKLPCFRNLYDRSVVRTGINDRANLAQRNVIAEQWLIALVWGEGEGAGAGGWKVVLYPVASGKSFWEYGPYYESASTGFDQAMEQSTEIKLWCEKDALTTQLKMSAKDEACG